MPLDNLSALVEGGVPPETVTLLNGSPGTGKSTLAMQLMADHLAGGGVALAITTEVAPSQILRRAALFGIDLESHLGHGLVFLDCYSWRTGKVTAEPHVVPVANLADLSSLSIRLSEALESLRGTGKPTLVVFDTPSALTLHAPGSNILQFLEVAFAKVRVARGSVIVPVEKDMHDEAFTAALASMSDGVVAFRIVEEQDDLVRQMRVVSMRAAPGVSNRWVRLRLAKGAGLALEPVAKAPA